MTTFYEKLNTFMLSLPGRDASRNPYFFHKFLNELYFWDTPVTGYNHHASPANIIGKPSYIKFVSHFMEILKGERENFDLPACITISERFLEEVISLEPDVHEYVRFYESFYILFKRKHIQNDNLATFILHAPTQAHALAILSQGELITNDRETETHLLNLSAGLKKHHIRNDIFVSAFSVYLENSHAFDWPGRRGTDEWNENDLRSFITRHTDKPETALKYLFPHKVFTSSTIEKGINTYPCARISFNCWDMVGEDVNKFKGINLAKKYLEQIVNDLQPYLPELGLSFMQIAKASDNTMFIWLESNYDSMPDTGLIETIINSFIVDYNNEINDLMPRKLENIVQHHTLNQTLPLKAGSQDKRGKI